MSLSQREKIASFITLISMLLLAIVPQRSFLPQGALLFNVHLSQIVALAGVLMCFFLLLPELKYYHAFKKYIRIAWPLLAYTAVELGFLAYGYLHRFDPGVLKSFPQSWWFNYTAMLLLLPGVFFLGYAINWDMKKQARYLLVALGVTTVIVLGEYLTGNGVANPIGSLVHFLNVNTDRIWQWSPAFESLRVTGLHTAPTLLAMFTISGMVWALSVDYSRAVRIIIFVDSALIMLMTASRTEFIAALVLILCATVVKIQNHGLKNWMKRSLPVLLFVVVLLVAGAGLYMYKFPSGFSAGLITRMDSLDKQATSSSDAQNRKVLIEKLDSFSSGRVSLWVEATGVIEEHPLGSGVPAGFYLNRAHAHNDFITKYITQGILGIVMLIMMFAWMSGLPDGSHSSEMGLYFAVAFFVVGLMDCVFAQSSVLLVPLFLMGLNVPRFRCAK